DGIRVFHVTGVQTCALPISPGPISECHSGTRSGPPRPSAPPPDTGPAPAAGREVLHHVERHHRNESARRRRGDRSLRSLAHRARDRKSLVEGTAVTAVAAGA